MADRDKKAPLPPRLRIQKQRREAREAAARARREAEVRRFALEDAARKKAAQRPLPRRPVVPNVGGKTPVQRAVLRRAASGGTALVSGKSVLKRKTTEKAAARRGARPGKKKRKRK